MFEVNVDSGAILIMHEATHVSLNVYFRNKKRQQREARGQRGKEQRRILEEVKLRGEQEKRREDERKRRDSVEAIRRSDGQCRLCGGTLSWFMRLLRIDRHHRCSIFTEE